MRKVIKNWENRMKLKMDCQREANNQSPESEPALEIEFLDHNSLRPSPTPFGVLRFASLSRILFFFIFRRNRRCDFTHTRK